MRLNPAKTESTENDPSKGHWRRETKGKHDISSPFISTAIHLAAFLAQKHTSSFKNEVLCKQEHQNRKSLQDLAGKK